MTEMSAGEPPAGPELTPGDHGTIEQASASASPAIGDMVGAMTAVERAVKQRRDTDTVLINYWLYFFLVSWVTFGIYGLILFFRRIRRADSFSERKQAYYEGLLTWTERFAEQRGKSDAVHFLLADARSEVKAAYDGGPLREINAGLSLLFLFITLGFYGLWTTYRLNRYWWDAQAVEQDFDDKLSQAWIELGLMRYPVSFTVDQRKRRSYALYLVLAIVTLGVWGIVWDYKIHTDPENLFPEFHLVEDTVLQTIRGAR